MKRAWRGRMICHVVTIEHEQEWSHGTCCIDFRDPDNNSMELIEARHYPAIGQTLETGQ